MHGSYRTIDVSRLGFARVQTNAPLREANVY